MAPHVECVPSASLDYTQMEQITDCIAAELQRQREDIKDLQTQVNRRSGVESCEALLKFVQRQVQVGQMSAQAAVAVLSGNTAVLAGHAL